MIRLSRGRKDDPPRSLRSPLAGIFRIGFSLTFTILLSLAACQGTGEETETEIPFLPPTLVDTPSPPPVPTATQPRLTVTPTCTDNLTYIEDLTIPDGAVVQPGAEIDKRWRVTNSGTCNWDQAYKLVLVSGPDLGAEAEQALFPARAGTESEIQILITAPLEPGSIQSAWQAVNPDGDFFGDPIYIQIVVEEE